MPSSLDLEVVENDEASKSTDSSQDIIVVEDNKDDPTPKDYAVVESMETEDLTQNQDDASAPEDVLGKDSKISQEFADIEAIFSSEVDFEDDKFYIGRHVIRNFLDPKSAISKEVSVPNKCKPTPVSLNNRIVFISIGSGVASNTQGKKGCGLFPACRIFWKQISQIAKVRILLGATGQVKEDVWACKHHNDASMNGYVLQTQTYDMNDQCQGDTSNDKSCTMTK